MATEVVAQSCSISRVPLIESFSGMISFSSRLPPEIKQIEKLISFCKVAKLIYFRSFTILNYGDIHWGPDGDGAFISGHCCCLLASLFFSVNVWLPRL